jgi:uncharacterized short protein YbdD (DUF466 family)
MKKSILLLVKKKYTNLSGGHWITVTKNGPLHGKHLYIDDNGVILAGKIPAEFHGKKLDELHDMDVPHDKKEDGVVKRPLPEKTPYLSKKPIHNTYSKKTPAELKAIITQAKANIKANGGNGWDKKVLAVASYYLNGGQKPDDAEFGPKKKVVLGDSKTKKEADPDEIPHKDELPIAHGLYSQLSKEHLEDTIESLKQDIKDYPESETFPKKLELANHYLKQKSSNESSEAPKEDTEWQKVKDSAPHQHEAILNNYYSSMDKGQLETAQSNTIASMHDDIGDGESIDNQQKQALDMINHYLVAKGGEAKEAPNVDPKETVPHKGKYPLTHQAVEEGDHSKIQHKQADLTSQMHSYISQENKEYFDTAKEKLEIVNHYAKHHGHPIAGVPDYEAGIADQQKNKQAMLDAQKKQQEAKVLEAQKQQEEEHKKKMAMLDDFHNPTHVIQSTDHEHHGTDIKNFGIDYKNSNHVHDWHKKIDHDAQGHSIQDLKIQASKITELISDGDSLTGKTNGSDVKAKMKVQKNLGDSLMHHDHFMKLAQKVAGGYGYPSDISKFTPVQRRELAHEATKNIISKWAHTSADHDSLAISMQLAAQEEIHSQQIQNRMHMTIT